MAITTMAGLLAGLQPATPFVKQGALMQLRSYIGWTNWYAQGNPAGSSANAAGINGQAVTPGLGASVTGRIARNNPASGEARLAKFKLQASQPGTLWIIDRLWQNSGLDKASTTAQAITPAALPARDLSGSTNGVQVMAAVEWSAAGGVGDSVVTLTYTDQDGNAGATASVSVLSGPSAGNFEIFALAAGDTGVRAPTSFIQSASRGVVGSMHLVLFRVIAQIECSRANVRSTIDALTAGFPRIYDDSVLQMVWFPTSTAATTLIGSYQEAHG